MKVLGVVVVAGIVAWGVWAWRDLNARHEVSILEASVEDRALALSLNACNLRDYEQNVDEGPSSVTVTVTAVGKSQDDCADGATVTLAEPLGERALIDGSNGEPIPTDPPP
jgi:hypothetical protein